MKKTIAILLIISTIFCITACFSGSSASGGSSNRSTTSFTNKYGTATTTCAHRGCTKYIASSGDTNCCSTHSNRCGECRCYIDEDATFCMSCLTEALGG